MTNYPQNNNGIYLQSLAVNYVLCHENERAANEFAPHDDPNIATFSGGLQCL